MYLLYYVLLGVLGFALFLWFVLSWRGLISLFSQKNKDNATKKQGDKVEKKISKLDPPDFDPNDDKPLPRKLPKVKSFAYYFGDVNDKSHIDGRVDLVIFEIKNEGKIETLKPHPKRKTKGKGKAEEGSSPSQDDDICSSSAKSFLRTDQNAAEDVKQNCNYNVREGQTTKSAFVLYIDFKVFLSGKNSNSSVFKEKCRNFIEQQMKNRTDISGLMFGNIEEVISKLGEAPVISVITTIASTYPDYLFFMEEGKSIFTKVSDFLNGVCLLNPTMNSNGRLRLYPYGDDTTAFEDFVSTLNKEIALRNDFLVLVLESVKYFPSPELRANCVEWATSNSFVPWICKDPNFYTLEEVKPLRVDLLKGGIPGFLEVREVAKFIENYDMLCAEGQATSNLPCPTPDQWGLFIESVKFKESFHNLVPHIKNIEEEHWKETVESIQYDKNDKEFNLEKVPFLRANTNNRIRNGQRFIGNHKYVKDQEEQLITTLSFLMEEGHLKNLADPVALELVPNNFDEFVNKKIEEAEPTYTDLLSVLRQFATAPCDAVETIFKKLPDKFEQECRNLYREINAKHVKVYFADQRAFECEMVGDGPDEDYMQAQISEKHSGDTNYLSLYDQREKSLNIFVRRDHPAVAEAVVYCYFASKNFSHRCCIAMQTLLSWQQRRLNYNDIDKYCSQSCMWQVEESSRTELSEFLMNTYQAVNDIRSDKSLPSPFEPVLFTLCKQVRNMAKKKLVYEVSKHEESEKNIAKLLKNRRFALENELTNGLGDCMVAEKAVRAIVGGFSALNKKFANYEEKDFGSLFVLASIFHTSIRRVLLKELCLKVMQKTPTPLPEPDQMTVRIEMTLSRDLISLIFHMESNDLGKIVYNTLRSKIVKSEVIDEDAKSNVNVSEDEGSSGVMKRLASGMFFTIPALIDVVAILFLGSGVFSSKHMSPAAIDAVNLSFLIVFATMGGVMNSIARVCAYYFSQYSIPLMVAAASRRVVAGFMFCIIFSLISFVVIFLLHDVLYGLLAFAYCLTFSIFLMFMAALFVMRIDSQFVLGSSGPQTVFIALLIILIPFIIVIIMGNINVDDNGVQVPLVNKLPFDVVVFYFAAMIVSTLFMVVRIRHVITEWSTWPYKIEVSQIPLIEELYVAEVKKPVRRLEESVTDHGKREKRWEKRSRDHFTKVMADEIKKRSSLSYRFNNVFSRTKEIDKKTVEGMINQRCAQYEKEVLLMDWYLMKTGQQRAPMWSFQWDVLLKQAIIDLKKKFSVEKLNRAGLLFGFEGPAIIFGWMYFFLIFIDRWVTIFTGNGIYVFLANGSQSQDYAFGVGWATVIMLVCAGTFELNLANISFANSSWKSYRLGVHGSKKLLGSRKKQKSRFYWSEFKRFMISFLTVFIVVAIIVAILARNKTYVAIQYFLIASFAYFGLLLGLFHKLFLTEEDALINKILAGANLFGIVVGVVLVLVLKEVVWALGALVAGSWFFGIACIFVQRRNVKVHRGVSLSPSLMSSGQNWIGADELAMEDQAKDKVIDCAKSMGIIQLQPEEIIGQAVSNYIQTAAVEYNTLPLLLREAFPRGREILERITEDFQSGQITLYLVLEDILQINSSQAYSALSEYNSETGELEVYVGSPKNADGQVMSHIVSEALVHEFCEAHGLTHYHSSVSELLLQADLKVPMRVTYQLTRMDYMGLQELKKKFGTAIRRESLMLVDIDTQWTSVPHELRVFLCGFLEEFYYMAQQCAIEGRLVTERLPNCDGVTLTHIQTMLTLIKCNSDESIEHPADFLKVYAARAALSYDMLLNVNDMAELALRRQVNESEILDKRTLLEMTYSEDVILPYFSWLLFKIKTFLRLLFMSITADSRFGRELCYGHATPHFLTYLLPYIFWTAKYLHFLFSIYFLWTSEQIEHFLSRTRLGLNREFFFKGKDLVNIKYYDTLAPITAFVKRFEKAGNEGGGGNEGITLRDINKTKIKIREDTEAQTIPTNEPFALFQYDGFHTEPPKGKAQVESYYKNEGRHRYKLMRQVCHKGAGAPHTTFYHYENTHSTHYPAAGFQYKGIVESIQDTDNSDLQATVTYGKKSGNIIEATLMRCNSLKPHKGPQEIEAHYKYADHGIEAPLISVSYSHTAKCWDLTVIYAGGVRGDDVPHVSHIDYTDNKGVKSRTHYSYTHPLHPTMQTMKLSTGNIIHRKVKISTPDIIKLDLFNLIHAIPRRSIHHDDFLLTRKMKKRIHGGVLRGKWERYFSRPATTQRKRMELWTLWRAGYIEGVHAMDIDELFLREEPILDEYWKARDRGMKAEARLLIESKFVQISNLVVQDTPQTRTHLQMRVSDLMELSCGGDASEIMWDDSNEQINSEILQVLSVDSGTWPTGGGGVGSCRRDLIDNLPRARWTAMAEIGTDSEMVQKGYQAERYVSAIHYIPLWGLDLGTPNQHVLSGQPYGILDLKKQRTTDAVVKKYFVPLVKEFIYGCSTVRFKRYQLELYGEMFVRMHLYFQEFDWLTSWNHESTRIAWYTTWFDILNESWSSKDTEIRLLQSEMPTLEDLDSLYELLTRLLFPLSATLPRLSVTHASHHGIQSLLGVVSKILYGSSLIVWDHGVLWRERLLALASLPSTVMAKFVQIGFVGLTRLAAALVYGYANCICPCTSIQNVQWEQWLGGRKFMDNGAHVISKRKISPVLNGMDVNRFKVNKAREAEYPTSVMLSHVNRIKDVMNAIEAAAVIVHEFNLNDYRLLVYGSKESDPIYANECANAIVALNLSEHVFLMGLGNPSLVLTEGWLFINSSVSEGLPLAIGEAGLCGLPVVCTDVGGSREVLSDTIPGQTIDPSITYGRIVPPRSPTDLAIAQLEVMGMLNGLEQIVDKCERKVTTLNDVGHNPETLLARFMDPLVKAKRRHLGLHLRSRVYKVFPISRYLRQHEQQLWIAALQCDDWDLYQMVQRYVIPRKKQFKGIKNYNDKGDSDDDEDDDDLMNAGGSSNRIVFGKSDDDKDKKLKKKLSQTGKDAMKAATQAAQDALSKLANTGTPPIPISKPTTNKYKQDVVSEASVDLSDPDEHSPEEDPTEEKSKVLPSMDVYEGKDNDEDTISIDNVESNDDIMLTNDPDETKKPEIAARPPPE